MTIPVDKKEINRLIQFIYENFLLFAIGFSILLFFIWNLTRYIFQYLLPDPNQLSLAYTLQDFLNSVLITILIIVFVISIQRREFSYFEHLSLMNSGIIKTSQSPYKMVYINQQIHELLGYNEDEMINKDLEILFCEEEKEIINHYLLDPSIPIIKNIEANLTTKTGKKTPVLLSMSRIYSVFYRKEKGLFIVINDIRSLKESQTQARHLMEVEKESVLTSFVQKVGHEINNPLTYMMYDSERLMEYVKEMIGMLKIYDQVEKKIKSELKEPEIKENINKIDQIKKEMNYETAIEDLEEILTATKEGINRIAKVVREVRTYPFQDTEMHRLSINNVVKLTIDLVKNYYLKDNHSINISTKLDLNIPQIPLKAGEIAQGLLNMLQNSIQAIEEAGKIEGKIEIQTQLLKTVSNDIDHNQLIELIIKDNGIGIEDKNLEKIFTPYYTTKVDGTGLGLSITKKVIEEHKGAVKIESEYKKGTKIIITLPAV